MLTAKQRTLLLFIHERLSETGVSPSFEEMKEALDLKSKSGIHRLITALEERGFLRRLPHKARALEILKLPETSVPQGPKSFTPEVVRNVDFARRSRPEEDGEDVPLLGRIAAGTPIAAIQHERERIRVPASMMTGGDYFALEVQGDSMIEAGILDGDTVVIKRSDDARNGEIVVALIEDEEATLKRLRRRGASIALEAANAAYETRIFGPNQVKVQGCLAGLLRTY